jgi:hypothetical protein
LGLQRDTSPSCGASGSPSEISVGPFVAIAPETGHWPLVPTVLGGKQFDVKAGERFHYRLSLRNTSKRPFRFPRCPVYTEDFGSFGVSTFESYVLNCKPVSSIGPGEAVVFEMVLKIPSQAKPGWATTTWTTPEDAGDLQEVTLNVRR